MRSQLLKTATLSGVGGWDGECLMRWDHLNKPDQNDINKRRQAAERRERKVLQPTFIQSGTQKQFKT